uniref:Uncharacterized protein n=1 Tax=Globisporangium ultimum (strain ATCC 200006 / CBS 805.95 / DAOM BR144) TaxID=431595 RepID=K3WYZ4_GLOUD
MRFLRLATSFMLVAVFSVPVMPHTTRDLRPVPPSLTKSSSGLYHPHEDPEHRTEVTLTEGASKAFEVHHHHHHHDQSDHSNADMCDCGKSHCRCKEALWDMVLYRVDESDMEEGMMDQGYRQHV